MSGSRSETPTPRIFLPQKTADLTVFQNFLQMGTHFKEIFFYLKKGWFFYFFKNFCEMGPSSMDFLTKIGPLSKDFRWQSNPFRWHIPVDALTCEYPPGYSLMRRQYSTPYVLVLFVCFFFYSWLVTYHIKGTAVQITHCTFCISPPPNKCLSMVPQDLSYLCVVCWPPLANPW